MRACHFGALFLSLFLTVPPMIWVPNQLIGGPLDGEALLLCNTEAFPISSINYWIKDDDDALMAGTKYEIINSEKSYKVHMTLRIRDLESNDFGTYKCYARNSLGSTEGSIKLYGECPAACLLSKGREMYSLIQDMLFILPILVYRSPFTWWLQVRTHTWRRKAEKEDAGDRCCGQRSVQFALRAKELGSQSTVELLLVLYSLL